MFTGLTHGTGEILYLEKTGNDAVLGAKPRFPWDGPLVLGESVCVSGVCLTVAGIKGDVFEAYASEETLSVAAPFFPRKVVNLERALRLSDRLGGHLVSGHADGVATILSLTPKGRSVVLRLEMPPDLAPFLAPKGSVAVEGVSLTINRAGNGEFSVNLIPETLSRTSLGTLSPGSKVNLEADVMARYAVNWLKSRDSAETPEGLTLEKLGNLGW
jgi:riboflavin synthase